MTQKRIILGITGYKGSGKSTVAKELHARGFTIVKFAGTLKNMLRNLGLDDRHLEGDLKEEPCDLLGGKTPRLAMQTLGTEWGRGMISNSLWIDDWKRRVNLHPSYIRICVDDLRFPNEQLAIRELGGEVLFVDRGGQKGDHASEDLSDIRPDYVLKNDGTLQELIRAANNIADMLKVPE